MKKVLLLLGLVMSLHAKHIEIRCIEEYKYLIVESHSGIAIVQMFKPAGIYPPRPVPCDD